MSELEALPDDVRELLRQAQDGAPPPPPGLEAAVLAKVSSSVATGLGTGTGLVLLKPVAGAMVVATVVVVVVGTGVAVLGCCGEQAVRITRKVVRNPAALYWNPRFRPISPPTGMEEPSLGRSVVRMFMR